MAPVMGYIVVLVVQCEFVDYVQFALLLFTVALCSECTKEPFQEQQPTAQENVASPDPIGYSVFTGTPCNTKHILL